MIEGVGGVSASQYYQPERPNPEAIKAAVTVATEYTKVLVNISSIMMEVARLKEAESRGDAGGIELAIHNLVKLGADELKALATFTSAKETLKGMKDQFSDKRIKDAIDDLDHHPINAAKTLLDLFTKP